MNKFPHVLVAAGFAAFISAGDPATADDTCLPTDQGDRAPLKQSALNPPITGHVEADRRIRFLAESRGYRPHPRLADEKDLVFPYSVHHCVISSWQALRREAEANGWDLSIVSGYRSVVKQRQIFLSKMGLRQLDPETVAAGEADRIIESILRFSSIPGYSRHHTGFTVDIQYNNEGLNAFGRSPAYEWISRDHFANARRFGFLPSYPEELPGQGPVPEPWEFIWVGDLARKGTVDSADEGDGVILNAARQILSAIDSQAVADISTLEDPETDALQAAAVQSLPGGG